MSYLPCWLAKVLFEKVHKGVKLNSCTFLYLIFQLLSIASSFSTRQLLRVARRIAEYPHEDLYRTINRACLAE